MTHIHEKTGQTFEVGRLDDFDGRTFDICVIVKWSENETEELDNPVIIDYYFGDYDKETTDDYIDQYLAKQSN